MYCMSMRFAPAASPMVMPSPVAPTESVDRMESSMAGLYFTRMSMFEPKPPLASTTALHAMVDSLPVTVFFTFTPVMNCLREKRSMMLPPLRCRRRAPASGIPGAYSLIKRCSQTIVLRSSDNCPSGLNA